MTRIPDFHEEMNRFQNHIPTWVGHNLNRLRGKRAIWLRLLTGVALIVAWGFLPLPLVGIWMLPVGLALLLMTFQPCVRQSLVSYTSLTGRLRNVRIARCPLYLSKQTLLSAIAMSAKCSPIHCAAQLSR